MAIMQTKKESQKYLFEFRELKDICNSLEINRKKDKTFIDLYDM